MLAFLPLVAAIYGPAARKEGVVVATASSFDEEVLKHDGPVAVQFYAPWCGHCKALKPAWKKATKALSPGTIKLVVVDATTEGALARKYGVKGYPSIQIFGSNKRKPETYQGARDESSLISGLRKMAKSGGGGGGGGSGGSGGDKSKPKPKRASSSGGGGGGHSGWGAGSAVEELGDSDFESRVMEGEGLWLVAFYAPWCGHCRNLEPEWKAAAARLEGSGFKLGAVDATQATGVASEHGVQGYPTIKFFNRGAATPYEGGRTAEDIVGHAMSALETSGVEAEVPQLTSAEQWRSLCGKKGTLCAVAFLPHILDSGAAGGRQAASEDPALVGAPLPPGVPTVGSVLHAAGGCKPCAFVHTKGCNSGEGCLFCHLCDPDAKKRRQKDRWEEKRRAWRAWRKEERRAVARGHQRAAP